MAQNTSLDDYTWVLKDGERDLMRELEPARLETLDEDELLDLHKRVRRARNKSVSVYRRKAARTVQEKGSRGAAHPKGAKSRLRAEAFEEALAIVSDRLAVVAHESAEQLKADRLAQARSNRSSGPETSTAGTGKVQGTGAARSHTKTTGGVKRDASSQSAGARRQAKKDAR